MRTFSRPGARFSEGCTKRVHVCFEPVIIATYIGVHREIPGRTVLGKVHPVGAPNKTLISDTGHNTS